MALWRIMYLISFLFSCFFFFVFNFRLRIEIPGGSSNFFLENFRKIHHQTHRIAHFLSHMYTTSSFGVHRSANNLNASCPLSRNIYKSSGLKTFAESHLTHHHAMRYNLVHLDCNYQTGIFPSWIKPPFSHV